MADRIRAFGHGYCNNRDKNCGNHPKERGKSIAPPYQSRKISYTHDFPRSLE